MGIAVIAEWTDLARVSRECEVSQSQVQGQPEAARFEQAVLPHLTAAYNLARWLTGNDHDAEDVVQESYLRALKFFSGFRGGSSRPWLLAIVRNTCYTWMRRNRMAEPGLELDEEMYVDTTSPSPEAILLATARGDLVRRALEELPAEFREIVILREMEGLSYKEIAEVTSVPVGTVMSRLARARARLQKLLGEANPSEARA
jgi:RNA polymerase sigma-70 factor (ECF subfamily)